MTQPVRSLRLTGRNSQSLDNITGSSGEIFYDRTLNCLRLYSGAANSSGGEKIADRDWVQSQNYLTSVSWSQVTDKPALFSGDYNNLTNKPTLFSGNYNDLTNKPAPVSLDGLASESYVTTALSNFIPPTPTSLSNMQGIGFEFGVIVDEFSSDPTFTDNSNTAVPTESAVRAYLDRRLGRDAEGTMIAVEAKIGPEYAVTDSPTFTGTVATDILTVSTDYHQGAGTNADLGNGSDVVFGVKTENNGYVAVIQSDTGSAGLKVVGTGTGLGIITAEGNGFMSLVSPDSTNAGGIEADRGTLCIRGAQKALDGSIAAQDIVLYTNFNQTALTITGTSRLVTVNNDLTVSGLGRFSYQNISPAGSTQETAAAITANLVLILNTAPSGGIRLPANVPYGTRILVRNSTAGARNVYPPTGEEVAGAGSVNAALSQTGLSWREYIKTANPLGTGADWWWALTPT